MKTELLICENDKDQGINLYSLIHSYDLNLEIKIFIKPENLLYYLNKLSGPAIILMDIVLDNNRSGIEIIKEVHDKYRNIPVVFISSFIEKACEVYEVDHCYFVFKPQKEQKLKLALLKALELLEKKPQKIFLHENQDLISLEIQDILCIERIRRATFITTSKNVYQVHESLTQLKEMLPESFEQCHRNYMVNFNHIHRLKTPELELCNGIKVPVSRRMAPIVTENFQKWLISLGNNIV